MAIQKYKAQKWVDVKVKENYTNEYLSNDNNGNLIFNTDEKFDEAKDFFYDSDIGNTHIVIEKQGELGYGTGFSSLPILSMSFDNKNTDGTISNNFNLNTCIELTGFITATSNISTDTNTVSQIESFKAIFAITDAVRNITTPNPVVDKGDITASSKQFAANNDYININTLNITSSKADLIGTINAERNLLSLVLTSPTIPQSVKLSYSFKMAIDSKLKLYDTTEEKRPILFNVK